MGPTVQLPGVDPRRPCDQPNCGRPLGQHLGFSSYCPNVQPPQRYRKDAHIDVPSLYVRGGALAPEENARVNHLCGACNTAFVVSPAEASKFAPGVAIDYGGYQAFRAHLAACVAKYQQRGLRNGRH